MILRRSAFFFAAACLVAGATVAVPMAGAEESDCRIPGFNQAPGAQTPQGHYEYQDWIANDSAQAVVTELGREFENSFGPSDNARDWLQKGVIGVALDHEKHTYIAVVDSGRIPLVAFERRLEAAAARSARGDRSRFEIEVVNGCFGVGELAQARQTLEGGQWHPDAAAAEYAFHLDAHDSTFHASFAPEDADVAQALENELGERVTIEYEAMSRWGRLDDGEPHWGGAGIRPGNVSGNVCTSGFTVRLSNGNLGSVSANHCFRYTGDVNGRNVYSGPEFYGETSGGSGFPTYDLVRIHPNGESFDNKIHVDPCCPSVRTVVADGNPSLSSFVCFSGMKTRAVCGAEVRDLNATFCAGGCTPNLFWAKKPGEIIGREGDSGGPAYNRFGDNGAAIRGMIVGGPQGGGDNVYSHKISTVKNHLNVTVAGS